MSNPNPSLPDRYAVAGNPVAHSQSPFIHAMFAQATGQALVYGRLLCPTEPAEAFGDTLRAFERDAGTDPTAGRVRGCNVTVPFKLEAFRLAPTRSERATLAQAANVLRFDAAGWYADNSDGIGLVRDIERHAGVPLAGQRVLLNGAGGAAAGALGPMLGAQPAQVVVANRTLSKAVELVQRHVAWAARHGVRLSAADLDAAGDAFDVVVNASASSLKAAAIPVSPSVLRPGTLALDMMYGPASKGFIDWAEAHGARGRDGLGMLVEQAAEAFLLWRDVMPDTAPVLAALREKLRAAAAAP